MKPPDNSINRATVTGTFWDMGRDKGYITSDPLYEKKIKDNLIEYFSNESIRMGLVSCELFGC